MARWYAVPDDLIGGWCVMTADLTPSQVSALPDDERRRIHQVADFTRREDAEEIARLHNHAEQTKDEPARLSRLLWLAREGVDMFADIVSNRAPGRGSTMYRLVEQIDEYRAEHGWSPGGFGGEQGDAPLPPIAPDDGGAIEHVARALSRYDGTFVFDGNDHGDGPRRYRETAAVAISAMREFVERADGVKSDGG